MNKLLVSSLTFAILCGLLVSVAVRQHEEAEFQRKKFLKLQESYMNSGACESCENRRWHISRTPCPICNPKGDKDIEPLPFNLRIPSRGKIKNNDEPTKDHTREDRLTGN